MEIAMEKNEDNEYGQKGKFHDYKIRSAAETLIEAEQIKKDKEMMPFVYKCMEEKMKDNKEAINSIEDLKKARDSYNSKEEDGSDS